jgi:phosphoribosylformimino-5-aminoimidazole carboxamide ribotide isomerase
LFELYPAIDLRDGRCVRLYQGDFGRESAYGTDPVAVALGFAEAGARWVHVVDLDAARTGEPVNRPVIAAIAEAVKAAAGVAVQAGGGVRDQASAEALFAAGVDRVVLGTAAVEQPALVKELAADHAVAVGIDARAGEVAVRGWTQAGGRSVAGLLAEYEDAGVAAVVVTEIERDGTLAGPAVDQFVSVLEATSLDVVASGGVGSLADLETLCSLRAAGRRLAGAIVGKALHDGLFSIEEAMAACAASA